MLFELIVRTKHSIKWWMECKSFIVPLKEWDRKGCWKKPKAVLSQEKQGLNWPSKSKVKMKHLIACCGFPIVLSLNRHFPWDQHVHDKTMHLVILLTSKMHLKRMNIALENLLVSHKQASQMENHITKRSKDILLDIIDIAFQKEKGCKI